MKTKILLFSLLFVLVAFSNAQTTLTLSPSTISGTQSASPWVFTNGCTITNTAGKAYSTGTVNSVSYIKLSAVVQFTVTLPADYVVNSVQFTGYDNYAGKRSYISEFNGALNTDSTINSFSPKDVSTAIICTNTITPVSSITNSFTFTITGNQTVLQIILNPTGTGVQNTTLDLDVNKPTNVYSIDGRRIKTNVFRSQATEGLQSGIYIIDNKKVAVTKIH